MGRKRLLEREQITITKPKAEQEEKKQEGIRKDHSTGDNVPHKRARHGKLLAHQEDDEKGRRRMLQHSSTEPLEKEGGVQDKPLLEGEATKHPQISVDPRRASSALPSSKAAVSDSLTLIPPEAKPENPTLELFKVKIAIYSYFLSPLYFLVTSDFCV